MVLPNGFGFVAGNVISSASKGRGKAEFQMSQLPNSGRVYQRLSKTPGLGSGQIPVTINATVAGRIYARCRAVSDGTTILQAKWAAASVAVGTSVVQITGVGARTEQFYLDLSADGLTWQNGTVGVFMGRLIGVSGQSQAVRQIAKVPAYVGTMSSLGVAINNSGRVYAAVDDTSITIASASWALPADAGPYTSTFTSEFLRRQIAQYGVACALIGYAKGDTAIADWTSGSAQRTKLLGILDAVGGFEAFYWHQGGNDAGAGTTKATYKAALDNLFADITAHNAALGSNYTRVLTAMATRLAAGAGTAATVTAIRQAAKEWAAANSGIYLEPHDLNLEDSVHQGQPGNIVLAQHLHRALATSDAGPTLGTPTRVSGSANLNIPVTLPTGATALVLSGTPASRFTVYPAGTMANAISVSSVAYSAGVLTLTLASVPDDTVALDVYAFLHPDPSGTTANANMIRDDNVADGISVGRSLEPTTSGPVTCAALAAATVPGMMSVPTLAAGDKSIGVTRASDPSTGGSAITSYDLRYSTDQTNWTVVSMNSNPQTISGLTNGTPEYVQTRANNAIGNGLWSASASATPAAAVSVPFSDTFTAADGTNLSAHAADTGQSWTAVVGTMLIAANEVYASASPATYRSSYTAASADAYVQATFKFLSTLASSANWLLCRSTATNTWYQGGYQQNGASGEGWYIGKTVAGTFSVIGFLAASPTGSKVLRLETQGTTIRLLVDGVQVISVTDSSITAAGNVGIRQGGSTVATATTGVHIDTMTAGVL